MPYSTVRILLFRHGRAIRSNSCHMSSGDITFYQVLGRRFIVINSVRAAFDLLEKRSVNYSDRPHTPMTDLCVPLHAAFGIFGTILTLYCQDRLGMEFCIAELHPVVEATPPYLLASLPTWRNCSL